MPAPHSAPSSAPFSAPFSADVITLLTLEEASALISLSPQKIKKEVELGNIRTLEFQGQDYLMDLDLEDLSIAPVTPELMKRWAAREALAAPPLNEEQRHLLMTTLLC